MSPEDGALAYSAGVAAGFSPEEMANSVAKKMEASYSYNYSREVEFVFDAKSHTCLFGPKTINLETKEVDPDSSFATVVNAYDEADN